MEQSIAIEDGDIFIHCLLQGQLYAAAGAKRCIFYYILNMKRRLLCLESIGNYLVPVAERENNTIATLTLEVVEYIVKKRTVVNRRHALGVVTDTAAKPCA